MNEIIARTEFLGQRPGEEPLSIVVEIGRPYRPCDAPEDWACPVSLMPLYPSLPDIYGVDSFQALCLALSLVFDLLTHFEKQGGSLHYQDCDGEIPLLENIYGSVPILHKRLKYQAPEND
jgi:hypothetical protein